MAQAHYIDLIKRRAAVKSLLESAIEDIASIERQIALSLSPSARKLELSLVTKRNFQSMLVARLTAIEADLAEIERQNMGIIQSPPV